MAVSDSWMTTKERESKIQASETAFLRRVKRGSGLHHITNVEENCNNWTESRLETRKINPEV